MNQQQARIEKAGAIAKRAAEGAERLHRESDRGSALVGAAMIDELLGALLRAYFDDERGIVDDLLEGAHAPLGVFSARIKLLRALSLISDEMYRDLESIREIRNLAAHFDRRRGLGFDTGFSAPPVAARCRSFVCLPPNWPAEMSPRRTFELLVGMLGAVLGEHVRAWTLARAPLGRAMTADLMHRVVPTIDMREHMARVLSRFSGESRTTMDEG